MRVTSRPERDPYAVLGVAPGAGVDELRAARRRLAKDLHPDRSGGDEVRMQELNVALDTALAAVGGSRSTPTVAEPPPPSPSPSSTSSRTRHDVPRRSGYRYAHDVASFTIEALPAEAFEALVVATTWIGEVVADDPPYQLEVELGEPFDCWCRLDLVPDAGASTVSVTLAAHDRQAVPDIDAVRDAWVATLNTLGRPD